MSCIYASQSEFELVINCSNNQVPGNGQVPLRFCDLCYWRLDESVRGFFAQTEQLLIAKQRRGEIVRLQKACGGCRK